MLCEYCARRRRKKLGLHLRFKGGVRVELDGVRVMIVINYCHNRQPRNNL